MAARLWQGKAVLVGLAALAIGLTIATPANAVGPEPARARSCAWFFEPTADRENVLFPEITTRYLGAIAPVPPGGYVEITGQFPHARYMSLQTYSTGLQSLTNLSDTQIAPDPGSTNRFLPGADRTATKRSYTVKLRSGKPPANGGPPNTLYDTSPDGSKSGRALAYRIYVPDRRYKPFGDVPAPRLTMVSASGARMALPTCPDLLPNTGLTETLAGAGFDWPLPSSGLVGIRTPVWHKYVNAPTSYAQGTLENDRVPQQSMEGVLKLTQMLPSGLGENADNKYVSTYLTREAGRVAVFRAKLPRTPRTFNDQRRMARGQLRFWSMCSGNQATNTYACVIDEDMPVDRNRYFTLVVSTAADRPSNATAKCGVAWLPWGASPKGILIMRNMLPAASFTQAVQNAKPGTEKQTLGPYYPVGRYLANPTDFEALGCG